MTINAESTDDQWVLTPEDHALAMSRHRNTRLGFAVLLTFFRVHGRFPRQESEVDPQEIDVLRQQLKGAATVKCKAFLTDRTAERSRATIRARFGFREPTVAMLKT
jgi:hypothetical protein